MSPVDRIVTEQHCDQLQCRLATQADLPALAAIHRRAYSANHFTSRLKPETLERYYSYFLEGGAETVVMQNTDSGKNVLGFAVYGTDLPARIARFKRDCFVDIAVASMKNPGIASKKVVGSLLSMLAAKEPEENAANFLLLSIAVAVSRRGIGRRLLTHLSEAAVDRGFGTVGLYVNVDNVHAINTYCGSGFRIRQLRNQQYYMEKSLGKGQAAFESVSE